MNPDPARRRLIALALALASLGAAAAVPEAGARTEFSQETCALCHIRESAFFSGDFADAEALKEFGEERLCRSCHNGAVRDSRAVLWRGAQHPAPRRPDGEPTKRCSRCHSPHEKGGWSVLAGKGPSLRKGGEGLCSGCHGGYARAEGMLHRKDFSEGGCSECHAAHGGVGKALLRGPRGVLCLRCHAEIDEGKSGGHPVSRVSSVSRAGRTLPECSECHPVHGSAKGSDPETAACGTCHPNREKAGRRIHPPDGKCGTCHSFHAKSRPDGRGFRGRDIRSSVVCGSCHGAAVAAVKSPARQQGTHVTIAPDGSGDLCFRCHRIHAPAPGTALLSTGKTYFCLECHGAQNTISEVAGIVLSHPVFERVEKGRLAAVAREKGLLLGPSGEIVCRTCHVLHNAAPGTALVVPGLAGDESCYWCHPEMRGRDHASRSRPDAPSCSQCHPVHGRKETGADPWSAVCATCHDAGAPHKGGRESRRWARPGDLPGFDHRGRRVRTGAISCPTCHEPHGKGDGERRLRRRYEQSGFLCTACHADHETVALTPHDLRGIAGDSVCEPCHRPHGGTSPWMWGAGGPAGEIPGEACRSCHSEGGRGSPIPRGGHPVDIVAARALPPRFPLFDGQGSRSEKGALSCPTCHEVHGTPFAPIVAGAGKLLRAAIGSAPEEAFIRDAACRPCHAEKRSQHGKADCVWCHPPHELRRPADECGTCHVMPERGSARTHALKDVGCGSCHRVHSPAEEPPPEGACLKCHAKSGGIVGTAHGSLPGGVCGACHPAHDNVTLRPPKRRAWEETFAADLPCLRCHREGGEGPIPAGLDHPKRKQEVPTSYGATVTLETPITMVGRLRESGRPVFPFFDEEGVASLSGRMGCLTCHDPHAGPIMSAAGADGSSGAYLRDPSGVFLADICAACHRGDAGERARRFHDLPRKTN